MKAKLYEELKNRLVTEGQLYNEDEELICSIEFTLDEGYCLLTPCVINGVRQNSFNEEYFDKDTAMELVNGLNKLMGF